ncbi:uncharacterized protein LOC109837627 [Asparagus officinalis]|nr:uncharacterized protein LOC109837627 [Asparagus officinalis]
MRRGKMWKHKKAAWLFYHLGIDASALLFADEVDLEGLLMAKKLSILVVGQDVLKTNGEVGSQCTVLTDNYCEDAYSLLQAPNLKKLLLAGILLDTENLNSAANLFTNRDAEAVQLLLVGSSPNYRYELFEQLTRDHRSNVFLEAMRSKYGKPSTDDKEGNKVSQESRLSTRKSASISPREAKVPSSTKHRSPPAAAPASAPTAAPVKAQETVTHGKNKNFFAKFFSFGSK